MCGAAAVALAVFCSQGAHAAIKPAPLFTDNAVLQRNMADPVWGTSDPNEAITVSIARQVAKTKADASGNWKLKLNAIPAGGPYTLTIAGTAGDTVTLNNVLVGEVWVCSGQSNMEYPMTGWNQPALTKDAIPTANDPMLHFIIVPHQVAVEPKTTLPVAAEWQVTTPDTAPKLTAVGYFFARDLRKALGVPIGLIHDNWGGMPAQTFTSREALAANPMLRHYLAEEAAYPSQYPQMLAAYYANMDKYRADQAKYNADAAAAKAAGGAPAAFTERQPGKPPVYENWPSGASHLFNGMINPIIPYGIRGAIWYQGEANGGQGYEYKTLFPTMIADWRSRWGEGNFPFLFVQLAPFQRIMSEPMARGWNGWGDLREAQRETTLTVPNTGMAVITDLGDSNDIHPRRKEPVGERLALIARAKVYGEKNLEFSGPVFEKIAINGSKARVYFVHAEGLKAIDVHDGLDDGPLVASAGKLVGFELAGADQVYYAADAVIDGSTVVVTSPNVPKPVAVRYGWAQYPVANLSNAAGLPASPFKSDNWSWASEPKASQTAAK